MAQTKRFKALPKDAKRAAFANMDAKDNGFSKAVKKSANKYPHIYGERGKQVLADSLKQYKEATPQQRKVLKGTLSENVKMSRGSLKLAIRDDMRSMIDTGRHKMFLSTERAFRLNKK